MFFDRFLRRPRRSKADRAQTHAAVVAARAAGPEESLVYDVDTGEVYYLLTRVKRRPA